MKDNFLWVEKWRPHTVQDCVLPDNLKDSFQEFVDQKNLPNLLLSGGPGIGKTTVAIAMCEEVGCDYIMINASKEGNMETLRTHLSGFASTVSLSSDGRKMIILDEADYLTHQTQPALRGVIDEFAKNCGFILTCNYKNRIIGPLQSRCTNIEFSIGAKEQNILMAKFMDRVKFILEEEGIEYDMRVIAQFIKTHFPDFRRVLNELQRYAASGVIDAGLLAFVKDARIDGLVPLLRDKDFGAMRAWAVENNDIEPIVLYRKIYDTMKTFLQPQSVPQAVLILNEAQKWDPMVADKEINFVATMTEIMAECKFN